MTHDIWKVELEKQHLVLHALKSGAGHTPVVYLLAHLLGMRSSQAHGNCTSLDPPSGFSTAGP